MSDTVWLPIETAPKDGTYVLLRFPGPFHDSECPGVAIGRHYINRNSWWLTCIWASSVAHQQPTHWQPLTITEGQ